jgi:hypothetical protein
MSDDCDADDQDITFDAGLGWRRIPVEDEAFPKMRRGQPEEWVRGWNRTPA